MNKKYLGIQKCDYLKNETRHTYYFGN